uniref:Reverse transcriptase/retrotransposon-derived protein RNase H-like domain-containing protein n=1 Tax=Solanum lycopersicum TaxID=4081 RepID=A0A3Q7IYG5_SOLLC
MGSANDFEYKRCDNPKESWQDLPPGGQPSGSLPPGGLPSGSLPPGGQPSSSLPPGGLPSGDQGELRMDEAKVKAIQDWEAPMKVTELRSFLGLANYYRRFISGYSAIAAPLTELLKKNRPWLWSEECHEAFEGLKAVVTEEPVLMLPDFTKTFEIHMDASDIAIGGHVVYNNV